MEKGKLFSGVTSLIFASISAQAQCPANIGDKVSFEDPSSVYDSLSTTKPSSKGEFETSEAYRNRVVSEKTQSTILANIKFDIKNLSYDADQERFVFKKYALNGFVDWKKVLYEIKDDLTPDPLIDDEHGIELSSTETFTKSYSASNGYGQTVSVQQYSREKYALFDKYTPWRKEVEDNWNVEFKHPHKFGGTGSVYQVGSIGVDVPLSDAPSMKSKMQMGVYFTPKQPLTYRGSEYKKPVRLNPKEVIGTVNVIFGDIHCIVITDDVGRVLKTVIPAY